MKMEENEAGTFWIAEGAAFEDGSRQNRQSEYDNRNDVVSPVGDPA
jgi:hypothetical protein